jgi:hypothetical protein
MTHADEIDALSATPIILRQLLAGDPTSRPSGDEGWSAREIVAHLRDCEEIFVQRYTKMAQESEPVIAAFDQEALARDRHYAATDLGAALDAFEQHRGHSLELLRSLDDGGWQRGGKHEEAGRITIESFARHSMSHDLAHLRQIAEAVGGGQ